MIYIKKFLESIENDNKLIDNLFKGDFKKVDYLADRISKEIGYDIIKNLGKGSYGVAYLLDDNKVLKLTTNRYEINYAYKVVKRGKFTKYLSNYYNVYKIVYNDIEFYALLMDYIMPLSSKEKKLYSDICSEFFNYTDLIEYKFVELELDEQIDEFIFTMQYNESDEKLIRQIFNHIKLIAKEAYNTKIVDTWEMHSGNLGKKENGDWVFFDIITLGKINVDLSKIKVLKFN